MLLFELDNYVDDHIGYNDTLNPKIYDEDGNMRPEVNAALMAVAENFIDDLQHPDLVIHDIVLTGSSANYNWTKYSDIDLHLISDVDVFSDPELAEKYFNAAKNVWNNQHDVAIRGLDVEVYVEDDDEVNHSLGRYSVMNDEWIRKPVHNKPVFDKDAVNRKARYLIKEIERALDGDKADLEHVKDKIWKMRKAALAREGEFAVENLAFKVLRNLGYADKVLKGIRDAEDADMSVEESSMKISEIYNVSDDMFSGLSVKETDRHLEIGDPDEYEPDVEYVQFEIYKDGQRIGRLVTNDYFGYIEGDIYNKMFPSSLDRYSKMGDQSEEHMLDALNNFFASRQGQKWTANIDKYAALDRVTNDYRIKENADPNSAVGAHVNTMRGGVSYPGVIKRVKQDRDGTWWGYAKYFNEPYKGGFRVKLDPATFKPMKFDQYSQEWAGESLNEAFDAIEAQLEFSEPVAVKAVNMLNREFKKHGSPSRAFIEDQHLVNIYADNNIFGGIDVDIVDNVLDELGGMYNNLDPIVTRRR